MHRFHVKVLEDEDRAGFESPESTFTTYFREQASQAQRRHLSVVYIVLDRQNQDSIVGYYTISNSAIGTDILKKAGMNLGRYDLSPTTLLGMLSRCHPSPDKAFGKARLFQALATCARTSLSSGSVAVVLNPFDVGRADWYKTLAFKDLYPESPGAMLYYEMRKLRKLEIPTWE